VGHKQFQLLYNRQQFPAVFVQLTVEETKDQNKLTTAQKYA